MESNFQKALKLVLVHEGGFVDHPSDPGGATNKGVTLETFRRYVKPNGTVADLKKITDAQIATVYRNQYWNKCNCDKLPAGLDYAVFDFAVNSGPSRAARYLQAVLGVAEDGVIGSGTLGAIDNAGTAIRGLAAKRMAFLRSLKTWDTFGKGWTRRVDDVTRAALAMVGTQAAPQAIPQADGAKAQGPAKSSPSKPSATRSSIWQSIIDFLSAIFKRKTP